MNRKLSIFLIGLNLAILGLVLWQINFKPRFAYVELAVIYENFPLKKQLESKLDNVSSSRKSILDSLELKIKMLASQIDHSVAAPKIKKDSMYMQYENLRQEYAMKNQSFTEDNDRTKAQYNEQIWKQLNQYIKDYGKDKGYAFIFGADGTGSLMYGNEPQNITEDLKIYVSARFSGGKEDI
jgi:outer membrane protein